MRFAALIICVSAVSACSSGISGTDTVVRSDSAGVEIVISGSVDKSLPWTFERVGALRDSVGEPYLFTYMNSRMVALELDGSLLVGVTEPGVAKFDQEGNYVRMIGRRGNGPGELNAVNSVMIAGDTVSVWDPLRSAIVRWGPDYEPATDILTTGALRSMAGVSFYEGGLWVQMSDYADLQFTLSFRADTLDSPPLKSVLQPRSTMVRMCQGGIAYAPFFSPEIHWSSVGSRAIVTVGPDYDLWLYDKSTPVRNIRRSILPREVRPQDADLQLPDGLRVRFGNAAQPCVLTAAEVMEQAGAEPHVPTITDVVMLSDGTVWVQRTLRGESPSVLDVFLDDGSYVGSVSNMRLPITVLRSGEILFPEEDEDSGGTVLVRYRVAH